MFDFGKDYDSLVFGLFFFFFCGRSHDERLIEIVKRLSGLQYDTIIHYINTRALVPPVISALDAPRYLISVQPGCLTRAGRYLPRESIPRQTGRSILRSREYAYSVLGAEMVKNSSMYQALIRS